MAQIKRFLNFCYRIEITLKNENTIQQNKRHFITHTTTSMYYVKSYTVVCGVKKSAKTTKYR